MCIIVSIGEGHETSSLAVIIQQQSQSLPRKTYVKKDAWSPGASQV